MIETPVKPPPLGGLPAAPPPDPFTRVMEPPPDPGSRYEYGCRECGAPLHTEQAACLVCGAMVEPADAGMGLRRAVTASAAAVLLLGGAVGAAVAGLPGGKRVGGEGPSAVIFGKKPVTLPQATANDTSRSRTGTTPSLGGASTPKKPPPINHNTTTNSTTSSSGASSGGAASGGSGGSPASPGKKKNVKKDRGSKTSGSKNLTAAPPKLFKTGTQPDDSGFYAAGNKSHSGNLINVRDNQKGTGWSGAKDNVGIWIRVDSPGHQGLGIVSSTPGYAVSVYYSTASSPPPDLSSSGWTLVDSRSNAGPREKFDLTGAAQDGTYYMVLITKLPAGNKIRINEIQLLL